MNIYYALIPNGCTLIFAPNRELAMQQAKLKGWRIVGDKQ